MEDLEDGKEEELFSTGSGDRFDNDTNNNGNFVHFHLRFSPLFLSYMER